MTELAERLPENFAQLDAVPDEEVVSYLLSCLEERGREAFQRQFPQGFWSRFEGRETGGLVGFAFMLSMLGVVRDRRVRKGSAERRMQHFRGQFRDAMHIENAARCAFFLTADTGAARLARAVYAYAGVTTHVILLKILV